LTDKDGNSYSEEKTFVVDSRAPKVTINLAKKQFSAGEELFLKVAADSDTRQLSARIYGAKPLKLAWSNEYKTNVGKLQIPENLSAGKYLLTVTAEDFAHNLTTEEVQIEVVR
jgi:Ca-activated chloride channel homolog